MNLRKHIHWLFYGLFVLGCARQTSPTGGPKDTIPPILNQSNQKTDKQISIHNKLNSVSTKPSFSIILRIRSSPLTLEKIRHRCKNRVVIKLTSEQTQLHTPLISRNIRTSPKNSPPALKLAFSTGDYIDSLSFSGTVSNPLTSKEVKDITVAIYQQDTFNIFNISQYTLVRPAMYHTIANLKPGIYRLYAFDDKNKNLIVDSKTEFYGFLNDVKQLSTNMNSISIPVIRLDARPLKLTSARPSGTFFNIKTSKNLKTYTIDSPDFETIYTSFGEDNANIRIYNNLIEQDSIPIHFLAHDSINNKIDTTLFRELPGGNQADAKTSATISRY
jgi:hypothetical protein